MYNHARSSSHNTQQQDDMMPGDLHCGLYRRPCPPPRPFRRNAPVHHFMGDAWHARFVLFCAEGCVMSLFYQCVLKQIFANQGQRPPRPLPPPVAVCRPFRRDSPAHHIMVDAWCARFVLFCDGGWLGRRNTAHREIDRGTWPESYVATNHLINATIK